MDCWVVKSFKLLFINIAVLSTLSHCAAQGSLHCKMKAGCNFPQCDPLPAAINKFGFNIDDYLQVKEFPIICESRGQSGSVSVSPEIVNNDEDIDYLKQELAQIKRINRDQAREIIILNYKNSMNDKELKTLTENNKLQAKELSETREKLKTLTENNKLQAKELSETQENLRKQNKELEKLQANVKELMEGQSSAEGAKVTSTPQVQTTTSAEYEGALRLVGGRNNKEGRVEIYHQEKWGTICDMYFGIHEANAVCNTLGFNKAKYVLGNAHFGQGSDRIWIYSGHTCDEDNNDFYLCHGTYGYMTEFCDHSEDASVVCN